MSYLASTPTPTRDAASGPDAITYGAVHLDVVDVERSLALWRDRIGLVELSRSARSVELGVGQRPLIVLYGGAVRSQLRGHAGLYHVALHLPDERELARAIARLAEARVPQAPTDHVFSKATYLSDPDGIGIELTLETPERFASFEPSAGAIVVRDSDGRRRGATEPLDVREVLTQLGDGRLDRPLRDGTTVGHVHLHVPDLDRARRFYRDVVGFEDHVFMDRIGMADLSAGGRFPHRLALNVWHGPDATQPLPGTAGLRHFELQVADRDAFSGIVERLERAGVVHDVDGENLTTHDPAGNALRIGAAAR